MKRLLILVFGLGILLIACETEETEFDRIPQGSNFSFLNYNDDKYSDFEENKFIEVSQKPISTFSIDADGASYANVRRFILEENRLPEKNAIRTEELLNYFDLNYNFQSSTHPVAVNGEISACPWDSLHKLIRIGLKGEEISKQSLPASNFSFLIDVSGSMQGSDRLELVKSGFKLLVDELDVNDKVSLVTYSSITTTVLESVSGDQKSTIKNAIDALRAAGSTNGGDGIIRAYDLAEKNFVSGGNNRIILATDGDLNVGITSQTDLVSLIEEKRDNGIYLTVLGVGRGAFNDAALEQIADKGNGTYEYLDNLNQIRKVFVHDFGKFFTIAKDVKVQVEFNPTNVRAYRLIGYENRSLNTSDFENDSTDAGELGANQSITALYEIIPQLNSDKNSPFFEILFRYKRPTLSASELITLNVLDNDISFNNSSPYMKFSASVAAFGMLLRDSEFKGSSDYQKIQNWINSAQLEDKHGYKAEYLQMVQRASTL